MNFFKKLFGKGLKPTPQSVSQSEASPLSDNFESDIPESLHEACAMGIPSIVRQVPVSYTHLTLPTIYSV
mgnify:CR=1 FL=1